jgi:hypothetical protein
MRHLLICVALTALPACGILGDGSPGSGAMQSEQNDIAQYNTLQTELDKARTVVITATTAGLLPSGNQLYWLDESTFSPTLHRYDDTGGPAIDYTFSVGDSDMTNFRASGGTIVTATVGNTITYTAYDATQPDTVVGTTMLTPPDDGTQWYAYATDANKVYIVVPTTDSSGNTSTQVQQWIPGSAPTVLTTLEAAGVPPGEFIDFDVFGTTMIFIDSGALWKLDPVSLQATSLGNMNESGNTVELDTDAVIYTTSQGLFFYSYGSSTTLNISQLIMSASYRLNATFNTIQYWNTDFARYQDWIVYVSTSGVFAYNLTTQAIKPILLSPLTADPVQYRYPCVLDDGNLLIVGITDTLGPTYRISLPAILGQ